MPTDPGRILIIGAGPTGLGAAYRLHQSGFADFLVLEAEGAPGGLAASHVDAKGFTWDMGGHVQFSHYSYYDRVLDAALGDRWLWHERDSWVWIRGRFVPYPFQNNIHRLDPDDCAEALRGLEQARQRRDPNQQPPHFAAWIDDTLGEGIARMFMRPYNRKVWGVPLEALDTRWMGDRVTVPDIEQIKANIVNNRDDLSQGPNRRFRFPMTGGTGAIWRGVAGLLPQDRLLFGERIASLDLQSRTVRSSNGRRYRFDVLLSTIPLDTLVGMAEPLPTTAVGAARTLHYSSVHVLGVGLAGPRPPTLATKCWIYFPEDHSPYYRVTVFSNYSPQNVPSNAYWSLMAEVCESPRKPVDSSSLRERTLGAMQKDGLITNANEVVSFWHRRAEHGYPTPFLGRDDVLDAILPTLEAGRVYSRGRFGGWKYEVSNQDHSFMQGVEWTDFVLDGKPEVTFRDPNRANSGVFLDVQSSTGAW